MTSDDLLASLNDKQIEAVLACTGPTLVIAGAGSGKTKALTHRIAYLIREKRVNPWNILAVTFTNKAATEMKNRISKLLTGKVSTTPSYMENPDLPTIGTFHSICVRILRKEIHQLGYENSFVIYDAADQQILVKRILKDMQIDEKQFNPRAILAHISNAKNQLVGPEHYSRFVNSYFGEKVEQIYRIYQAELVKNGALDFDDIIMKTVEVFQKFPEILDKYQEKYRYISVDEYQDTNQAQYLLVSKLAEKYRNICVIGDEDQSIYSWRGANIQNILDFEKDYPEAKVVKLEQNYRSTQNILSASNAIIVKNKQRKGKKLWTEKESGENVSLVTCRNERHEGEYVAQEILRINKSFENPSYKNFVVLYRTNAQSRVMEEVFLRYGIPYQIVGGTKFYDRKEIKDILAYLRLVQNPADSVGLHRVINTPPRKIGAKTLATIQEIAKNSYLTFFEAMQSDMMLSELGHDKVQSCQKFVDIIRKLQTLNRQEPASAMIKYVLEISGYKDLLNDGSVESESRLENIYELISVASKYDQLDPGLSLSIFLEEISLISDIDGHNNTTDCVTFMTVHSAKGLEFPYVFLVGLEEGIFPHSRTLLEPRELEEERRLMYVAMTRAEEKLYLLHAEERLLYGENKNNAPSQFLIEVPENLLEFHPPRSARQHTAVKSLIGMGHKPLPVETTQELFSEGDKVHHDAFGSGKVVSVRGGVATIVFERPDVGIKKLALSIAPLKKIAS